MKKVVTVLLCCALLMGSVCLPGQEQKAQANLIYHYDEASKVVIDGVTYAYRNSVYNDGEIQINAIHAPANITKIVLPAEIDGKPVTVFNMRKADGAEALLHVTSLTFSANMKYKEAGFYSTCQTDYDPELSGQFLNHSLDGYFTGLEELLVDAANPYMVSKNGIVYTRDMKKQIYYPYAKKDGEYKEPDTIEDYLDDYRGRKYLKKLTVSSNKRRYSLQGCAGSGLETVVLSSNIEYIPDKCFMDCTNLKNVHFMGKLIGIGESAFRGCSSLQNFKLQDGLAFIHSYAFWGTGIKKITIPDSVTGLGKKAFSKGTKVKKPKYLKSAKAKYADSSYYKGSDYKYIAMATLTNKKTGKKKCYPADGIEEIWGKGKVVLKKGQTCKLQTKAEVSLWADETKSGIIDPEILYYKVSKKGVISITKKGKMKALKKGTVNVYVGVRTENFLNEKIGYKVKVKVK